MMLFLFILMTSQIAAQATHALAQTKYFGSVRASAFLTLVFIGCTSLFTFSEVSTLQAVFLGASFVGMTDPLRHSRWQICLSGFFFSLVFYFLIHFLNGLGGVLGFSAFIACLMTHFIWQIASHHSLRFRRPDKF